MLEEVTIDKLVHGGQGIGTLPDGRKIFVWNALPGERVMVQIWRGKKKYAEGLAVEILEPSPDRTVPFETNYLATSPWQILKFETENRYKAEIVRELFEREKILLPEFECKTDGREYGYRNKMEYSFWGDEDGLHLALYARGSHRKDIVNTSKIAMPEIDAAANAVLRAIPSETRAGDLKTIIVRANKHGDAVGALFVKSEIFPDIALPKELKGLRIYHSNPKSPASVPTRLLSEQGDVHLSDVLLGQSFTYDVDSFFQVNVPIFEVVLAEMKKHANDEVITDMYAGVGTIGLSLGRNKVQLIELDQATAAMARVNAEKSSLDVEVIEASTEKVLDYITSSQVIVFDPPRAGLHQKVVERVLEALPPKIIYLSCNPATQARDIALLQTDYEINFFEAYNFFPHTPHIETLAVLTRK